MPVTRPVGEATQRPAGEDRLAYGVGAILFGMAAMVVMDATAKWLGAGYPIGQVVFFRNLFGLLPVLFVIWRSGGWATLRSARPGLHLVRAAAVLVAIFSFFFSLRFLSLAEATAIAFVAPLFVTGLSVPLLGERVGVRRWAAVIAGFGGVLVMLRPGAGAFQVAALLPALAALGYAVGMLVSRRLSRHDSNAAIMFHSTVIAIVFSGLLLPFGWRTPDLADFGLFALMGLVGGIGLYFMTIGYRSAPAAVIAPFEYSALLWAVALGWLVWRELPEERVWLGAAVIIASGLYILQREARLARNP